MNLINKEHTVLHIDIYSIVWHYYMSVLLIEIYQFIIIIAKIYYVLINFTYNLIICEKF